MDLIEGDLTDPIKHWYYAHKFRVIKSMIKDEIQNSRHLVDIGAGSALFSLEFLKTNPTLKGTAVDTGYEEPIVFDAENRITYRRDGDSVSGDVYLFTDVLEHVLNDIEMLSQYVVLAPKGSKFVITVPAFMSLWSGHDVFLKHYRRYERHEISEVVEQAGLKVLESQYLYTPLFPFAWIVRKLPKSKKVSSQLKDHGITMNRILLFFLNIDFLIGRFSPFGVSIIVLAMKPTN